MTIAPPRSPEVGRNWAGNHRFTARQLHRPRSVEQLQQLVAGAHRLRALGSRHSFNDIADSPGDVVTLTDLPREVSVSADRSTVTVGGGTTYGELAVDLQERGLALSAMASLPHISVAGAVATATHGSGDAIGNLATAVAGVELVRGDGELVRLSRAHDAEELAGVVVGLGALGVVTALTLDVVPSFDVRQDVYLDLPHDALAEHLDDITSAARSVSVFTRWGADVEQVWLKSEVPSGSVGQAPPDLFGARPAPADRNPVPGAPVENATPQRGVPGPWLDRLPHFRIGFRPSDGDEVQSEYLLPRARALEAVEALRALGERLSPLLMIGEVRTIAADQLWMSPAHHRDCIAFHFTWHHDDEAIDRVLHDVEDALLPLQARPHWGKAFHADGALLAERYERMGDFRELVARYDPQGTFRNAFLERTVLTDGS